MNVYSTCVLHERKGSTKLFLLFQCIPTRGRKLGSEVSKIFSHVLLCQSITNESVQSPLFVILINYLDENVGSNISNFADDTTIGGIEDSEEVHLRLQQDLCQ